MESCLLCTELYHNLFGSILGIKPLAGTFHVLYFTIRKHKIFIFSPFSV